MKFLCILAIAMTTQVAAQPDCSNLTKETDEFTGDTIVSTDYEVLKPLWGKLRSRVRKVNDSYYLNLHIMAPSIPSISIGAPLYLKMKDGTVVELECAGTSGAHADRHGGEVVATYPLTMDDLKAIAYNLLEKIRYVTNNGYVNADIPREEVLPTQAFCVYEATK